VLSPKVILPDTPLRDQRLAATTISSREDAERLAESFHLLRGPRDDMVDPMFFLASIDRLAWIPVIIVVTIGDLPVGLFYFKERKFAGVPTGIIYADGIREGLVFQDGVETEALFKSAISHLFGHRGARALRLLIRAGGHEETAMEHFLSSTSLDFRRKQVDYHAVLDLAADYKGFLDKLGYKTRRNFRYYRRRFEADGHLFVQEMSPAEFADAAHRLSGKSTGSDQGGIERGLRMLSTVNRPLTVGLKHKNGEWLSIIGGWYEADCAIVFFQMNNDHEYGQNSLSIVLRGYLIEQSIGRAVSRMLFWAGIGAPLDRYSHSLRLTGIYLDTPTLTWRAARRLIGLATPFLPSRMKIFAEWLVPDGH
jgi:hypothetical protein